MAKRLFLFVPKIHCPRHFTSAPFRDLARCVNVRCIAYRRLLTLGRRIDGRASPTQFDLDREGDTESSQSQYCVYHQRPDLCRLTNAMAIDGPEGRVYARCQGIPVKQLRCHD